MGKGMGLGQGGRFAKLKKSIASKGGAYDPGAVAVSIGRKKYGKKRFQEMAAKGRKRSLGAHKSNLKG